MKSLSLICLIVIVASAVNCEELLSSLYSRRIPNQQSEYQSRNVQNRMAPQQQEQAQAQHLRAAQQFVPQAQSAQSAHDDRHIDLIVRRYADQATQLVSHWARALKERMVDQAAAESQSQSFNGAPASSRIH